MSSGAGVHAPAEDGSGRAGAGVLENMSARPRTEIRRVVPPVQQGWVVFDLRRPSTRDAPDAITPEQHARLEQRWQTLGLTGATLVHPHRDPPPGVEAPLVCRDDDLTRNVLLRVRGNLLIYGMPMLDGLDPDAAGALMCAEPRLHAIVVEANKASIRARRRARAAELREEKAMRSKP